MFTGDLFAAVNNFIDSDVTQELTDEGCRHALKASAWRVIKEFTQRTRSRAFAAAVARKSRSIALAVFSTALALTADIGDIDERDLVRRLEPDVITYNSLISACDKGSYWEAALVFLWEMPRRSLQPELFSCDAAISACEKGMQ